MRRTRPPYPPEFRRQIVELARAGRSVQELAEQNDEWAVSRRYMEPRGRHRVLRPHPIDAPQEGLAPHAVLEFGSTQWPRTPLDGM